MSDEPEGNLSGVARPTKKVIEAVPVDVSTATFHPAGSVMDFQSQEGVKVKYQLTSQGWKLVKE